MLQTLAIYLGLMIGQTAPDISFCNCPYPCNPPAELVIVYPDVGCSDHLDGSHRFCFCYCYCVYEAPQGEGGP